MHRFSSESQIILSGLLFLHFIGVFTRTCYQYSFFVFVMSGYAFYYIAGSYFFVLGIILENHDSFGGYYNDYISGQFLMMSVILSVCHLMFASVIILYVFNCVFIPCVHQVYQLICLVPRFQT